MAPSLRRRPKLAPGVRSALELGTGERVLSWGEEEGAGTTVVATNHAVYAVAAGPGGGGAGGVVLRRPWHEVDAGTWSSELGQLTVTWVDGTRPTQWTLGATSMVPAASSFGIVSGSTMSCSAS